MYWASPPIDDTRILNLLPSCWCACDVRSSSSPSHSPLHPTPSHLYPNPAAKHESQRKWPASFPFPVPSCVFRRCYVCCYWYPLVAFVSIVLVGLLAWNSPKPLLLICVPERSREVSCYIAVWVDWFFSCWFCFYWWRNKIIRVYIFFQAPGRKISSESLEQQ